MAEDTTDQSQKTEEPTQKRLDDAREKGQVPSSREVNTWFMMLAAAVIVIMIAPAMTRDLEAILLKFIEQPHAIPMDAAHLRLVLTRLARDVLVVLSIPLVLLVGAALLANFVQTGFLFSTERVKPKLDKISLLAGARRLFSLRSVTEFGKGLGKIAVVGAVAGLLLAPQLSTIDRIAGFEALQLLHFAHGLIARMLIGVVAVITVIAALDLLYVKFDHLKQLRMSRQDIKDELKQTEGDPMVRQRLRQIRRERARTRIAAAVPQATVVITNPTHYAVALKYELDEMPAPVCVAKGIDHLALRIRAIAEEHRVAVVENPAVARALYATVEVDQEIPPEHYKAVAEIIGYVMGLGNRR